MGSGLSLQVIIFLLILAASGVSWLFRKLAEAKARKAEEDRERHRQEEMLRTGRDPLAENAAPNPMRDADANARLREIAARRQAQLRELRRKQTEGSPATTPPGQAPEPTPQARELWPGGPVVVINPSTKPPASPPALPTPNAPNRPLPTPAAPRPVARPKPRPPAPVGTPGQVRGPGHPGTAAEAVRAEQRRKNEARTAALRRQAAQQADIDAEIASERSASDQRRATIARITAGSDAPVSTTIKTDAWRPPNTVDAWRNAFIAAEVLAAPLALRREDQHPGRMPG
jgi:hypothetical protein